MKGITLPQHGGSLLKYATSKLNPEVFSHPVWIRFGRPQVANSIALSSDLFSAAEALEKSDLSEACQILLLCAAYQNYAGQHYKALKTTQKVQQLAQHNGLARELMWAVWGTCAIFIQQGNFEQAASNFVDLQTDLREQNEWVLANFINEIKQFLFQPTAGGLPERTRSPRDQPSEDLLTFTFDWLQHWGFSSQAFEPDPKVIAVQPVHQATKHSTLTGSFFSMQRWQGRWHTLLLAVRGELKLQWVKNDASSTKKQGSFWGSLLSSLHRSTSRQNTDTATLEDVPQIDSILPVPAPKEITPPKVRPRKPRPAPTHKRNAKHPAQQAATVIPVTVHMLGTFCITVQNLTLKLPASRALSVFKYLLVHHKQKIPREVLMDVFWPDAEPETARNNLNVAIHSLRKALRAVIFMPMIVFEDGAHGLDPNLEVWIDVEEFGRCVQAGQRLEARNQLTAAVAEYEAAISLYQGDFLEETPYEEWTILDRERVRVAYLEVLDRLSQIYFGQERYAACIAVCQLMLAQDSCREDAHCLLMRCYSRQGQHYLALRQYQACVAALQTNLDVTPAPTTVQLFEQIRQHKRV